VAYVQAGPGGIAAHIKGDRPFVHEPGKGVRIGALLEQAPGFKGFQNVVHGDSIAGFLWKVKRRGIRPNWGPPATMDLFNNPVGY
jgi:hypothetical protein